MAASGPRIMRINMKISCLLILLSLAATPVFAGTYLINDSEMLFNLVEVQEEVDFISSAIMGCLDSGRDQRECMCDNKGMMAHFSATVKELFKKHPELKNQDLVEFKDPGGMHVTQSLDGFRKQAEIKLNCSE